MSSILYYCPKAPPRIVMNKMSCSKRFTIPKPFLPLFFLVMGITLYAQENITAFDNTWAVKLSLHYRFLEYNQEGMFVYRTNKPYELGIGASYKQYSFGLNFNIPFLHVYDFPVSRGTLDMSFDYYGDYFSLNAFIGFNPSFFIEKPSEISGLEIDLTIFSAGITARWILSPESFSMRSVYKLDRRQNTSGGSFWAGFDNYIFSIYSEAIQLRDYEIRQVYLYTGPAAGYAYTWTFDHGLFLDLDLGGSVNFGIDVTSIQFLFMPVIMPRITFGAHYKSWSFTVSLAADIFLTIGSQYGENSLLGRNTLVHTNAAPFNVSRRF